MIVDVSWSLAPVLAQWTVRIAALALTVPPAVMMMRIPGIVNVTFIVEEVRNHVMGTTTLVDKDNPC